MNVILRQYEGQRYIGTYPIAAEPFQPASIYFKTAISKRLLQQGELRTDRKFVDLLHIAAQRRDNKTKGGVFCTRGPRFNSILPMRSDKNSQSPKQPTTAKDPCSRLHGLGLPWPFYGTKLIQGLCGSFP